MKQNLYVVMSMKSKRKMQLHHINHQNILQIRLLKLKYPSCPSPKYAPHLYPGVENACMAKITFSDDDLLFGDIFHNCPLFIEGFMRDKRVNRILVDGGSGINILPILTMKELGVSTTDLIDSRLMIQGFNQGGKGP